MPTFLPRRRPSSFYSIAQIPSASLFLFFFVTSENVILMYFLLGDISACVCVCVSQEKVKLDTEMID